MAWGSTADRQFHQGTLVTTAPSQVLWRGLPLSVDSCRRTATGRASWRPTEYAVLYKLAVYAPRVLNHQVLLQRVCGPERVGEGWLLRGRGKAAAAQTGGRRRRPQVHRHRATGGVPDGRGRGRGAGGGGG